MRPSDSASPPRQAGGGRPLQQQHRQQQPITPQPHNQSPPSTNTNTRNNNTNNVCYDRARVSLARAIALDERKQHREAIPHYSDACEQVLLGLKQDRDGESRQQMIRRVRDWLERAETLKATVRLAQVDKASGSPCKEADTLDSLARSNRPDPFDGVVGLEDVKQTLRETILLPALQPQLFVGERKPWRGVLLFGPPGTGKSLLASAVAEEAECEFFAISSSDVVSKYLGESERSVKDLFERARKSVENRLGKRAVIFIDEIDAIGQSRDSGASDQSETSRRLLTELLRQMDGVGVDNSRVVVMAATNIPYALDSALRRRFERRLYVPLPGVKARAQMIAKRLGPPGVDHQLTPTQVASLAVRTKGYSGADIASLANEVLLRPVRTCLSATHFARTLDGSLIPCTSAARWAQPMRMLDKDFDSKSLVVPLATMADAELSLIKSKPSVNEKELDQLVAFAGEFGEKIDVHNEADEQMASLKDLSAFVEQTWSKDPRYRQDVRPQGMMAWAATAIGGLQATVAKLRMPS